TTGAATRPRRIPPPCPAQLTGREPPPAGRNRAGAGAGVVAHAAQHDGVQGVVGCPVAAAVEPVSVGAPGAGGDRRGAAQVGQGGLGAAPFGVVAGGDQQLAGHVGSGSVDGAGGRGGGGDQGAEAPVGQRDLGVQAVHPAGDGAQRGGGRGGGIVEVVVGGGQAGAAVDERGSGQTGQGGAQRLGCGGEQPVQLVRRGGAGLDRAAAADPQGPNRLDRAGTGLRCARG